MRGEPARAHRVRLPPGEWLRRHIVQLTILAVVLVLLVACCNLPAWPTMLWYAVGHDCGAVQMGVAHVTSSDATRAETCFAQAYQRCSAAKLAASFTDVDSKASYTFVIEPYGFTCAVGVFWSVGGTRLFSGGPGIGYCSGLRLEANGLRVLGCQSVGTIFVPGGV